MIPSFSPSVPPFKDLLTGKGGKKGQHPEEGLGVGQAVWCLERRKLGRLTSSSILLIYLIIAALKNSSSNRRKISMEKNVSFPRVGQKARDNPTFYLPVYDSAPNVLFSLGEGGVSPCFRTHPPRVIGFIVS